MGLSSCIAMGSSEPIMKYPPGIYTRSILASPIIIVTLFLVILFWQPKKSIEKHNIFLSVVILVVKINDYLFII